MSIFRQPFITFILIGLAILISSNNAAPTEPGSCDLENGTMLCNKDHKLEQFPTIPDNVQVFIMGGDKYSHLTLYLSDTKLKNKPNLVEVKIFRTMTTLIPERLFEGTSNLVKIDLSFNMISHFYRNSWFGLNRLRELILKSNRIASDMLYTEVFEELTNLELLDLSNNHIEQVDNRVFGKLIQLRTLNLSNNPLKVINPNAFPNVLDNLRYLDLSNCLLKNISTSVLAKFPQLASLNLNSNQLTTLLVDQFGNQSLIKEIDLSNNTIVDISVDAFDKSTHLNVLNLSKNPNLNIDLVRKALNKIRNLIHLDLSSTNINDKNLESEPFKFQASSLQKLNLSDNQLTKLPSLPTMPKITELDLSLNSIKSLRNIDEALPSIVDRMASNKTYLYLHHNSFSCLLCDLEIPLKISKLNTKCALDNYYCLTCADRYDGSYHNLSILEKNEKLNLSTCEPAFQSSRTGAFNYDATLGNYLVIIILITALSVFVVLNVIYRRSIYSLCICSSKKYDVKGRQSNSKNKSLRQSLKDKNLTSLVHNSFRKKVDRSEDKSKISCSLLNGDSFTNGNANNANGLTNGTTNGTTNGNANGNAKKNTVTTFTVHFEKGQSQTDEKAEISTADESTKNETVECSGARLV